MAAPCPPRHPGLARRLWLACLLPLYLLLAGGAWAALPDGYALRPVKTSFPGSTSAIATAFQDQQLSVATSVSNGGVINGFWLNSADEFHTLSLHFGNNPAALSLNTTNFIGLSGGDTYCGFQFIFIFPIYGCTYEFNYGVRIIPPAAGSEDPPAIVSAFVNTLPNTTAAVAGSIPFMRFPGMFVEENAAGRVASTQLDTTSQFGILLREQVDVIDGRNVTRLVQLDLPEVKWLVGINDLAEPLVIAYDGSDGGCLVYGEGCLPEPTPCEGDPNPGNAGGNGGREDSGHAWGHEKCKDGVVDGNNGGGGTGGDSSGGSGGGSGGGGGEDTGGATTSGGLLLHWRNGDVIERLRFPTTLALDTSGYARHVFPLAISNNRVVLRGDLVVGSTVHEKRLLSCGIDPALLDVDANGIVDCVGGMQVVGGLAASIRAGTVLGFALTNAGVLSGNFGYSAAGVGTPMIVDLAASEPKAEMLINLVASYPAPFELNTLTDTNHNGRMTGYGYRDCGSTPEAYFIDPFTVPPASSLRFERSDFDFPAHLPARGTLHINPAITGGSGFYELRVSVRKPTDSAWTLLSDWSGTGGQWSAGDYQGDVCFFVEARDDTEPSAYLQTVVRYSVGSQALVPRDDTGTGGLQPAQGDVPLGQLLAAGDVTWLLLLLAGGLRGWRRRHR